MAGQWEDWFEREEFIGQISDMRVQNLQVEREVVQKRTFTRWMNLHLEKCDPPIEVQDLFRDIQDGHILMALLEELSGCKLLHGFKKSTHRIFRLNNIAKVLSFLEERNVKLVSIDASDVADGNSSIILGLIWNIILFFQIKELTGNIRSQFPSSSSLSSIPTSSDSDASYCSTPSEERHSASTAMREHSKAIKKLLQWVQKRTRKYGVAVQDFGKSWKSGLAFLAIIKSIDPSLVDMRKCLLRSARENLEDAFRIAHYSLGIPRLLEPEDVTINAPDEQSIIIYVSQFLEHFPGIEEDEHCRIIERSVSMCRLNYRDAESEYMRNGVPRSRVRERSYLWERDCAQPPPKILISSVSEDRGIKSPPFRVAAARSWSSEDILSETETFSSSAVEEPKEPSREVTPDSTSNPPQLSYSQSPTSSSVPESVNTESVIGDSAISSPDSWVESEFGVTPEKFCESRSDSSLCDSGTAWDVYRATPVEITTLDEGFVPSAEDGQSITESYTDEGIYSLSSLESNQDRVQGSSEKKQAEETKEKENKETSLEKVPDQSKTENAKDLESKQKDSSLQKEKEQGQSSGLSNAQEVDKSGGKDPLETDKSKQPPLISITEAPDLAKQTSVDEGNNREPVSLEKDTDVNKISQDQVVQAKEQTESKIVRNSVKEVLVETECAKTESPSGETEQKSREEAGILKEKVEEVKTQDKASEGAVSEKLDSKGSTSKEVCHVANKDEALKTSPAPGSNIPVISISSEPEEQDKEGTCDPGSQDRGKDKEEHQKKVTGTKETIEDASSPEKAEGRSSDSKDSESQNPVKITHSEVSENSKAVTESGDLDGTGENVTSKTSTDLDTSAPDTKENVDRNEAKSESEPPIQDTQTLSGDIKKDSTAPTSPTENKSQQDTNLRNQSDEHQDKLIDLLSDNEAASTQQSTSDPVNSKPNGTIGNSCGQPDRDLDLFSTDFDRNSPTDDLLGDPIEPMDLFYPDKEEPMITEPPDAEMQSWPSVLSVSPLEPAPVSETLNSDQLVDLLGDDFGNQLDSVQNDAKSAAKIGPDSETATEALEQSLLKTEGLWGGDVPEKQSCDSARENTEPPRIESKVSVRQDEVQIPPVLRHRKGGRLSESTNSQAETAAATNTDNNESEIWWRDGCELYLLLLLWLLLYCFWLLPQMDLRALPSLLLNL